MDKRLLVILVVFLLQTQAGAIRHHRYQMSPDVDGNCTDEPVLVTFVNEMHERPVKKADVDVFLVMDKDVTFPKEKIFNLETNNTGTVSFTPTETGIYLLQVDRKGYLRAKMAVDISACETGKVASTTIMPTTTTTVETTSTTPTTTVLEKPDTTIPVQIEPAPVGGKCGRGVVVLVLLMVMVVAALVLSKKIKV